MIAAELQNVPSAKRMPPNEGAATPSLSAMSMLSCAPATLKAIRLAPEPLEGARNSKVTALASNALPSSMTSPVRSLSLSTSLPNAASKL